MSATFALPTRGAAARYLAVSIAAFVLSALGTPPLVLGPSTPKPKLAAKPGSVFPDRTYVLQLSPRAAMPKPSLTENGKPVLNLAISAREGGASGTYVISYRSLLPPNVKAFVSATIPGFPAATTTYRTPVLTITASEGLQRRWMDSPYVTIFIIVAFVALMAFGLRSRLHRG